MRQAAGLASRTGGEPRRHARRASARIRLARALLDAHGLGPDGHELAPLLGLTVPVPNLVAIDRWLTLQLLAPPEAHLTALVPALSRALGAVLRERRR